MEPPVLKSASDPQISNLNDSSRIETGVGALFIATLLLWLRLPYNSQKAADQAGRLTGFLDLVLPLI